MDSSRRRLALWASVCFLIGAIGIAVAITGTVPVDNGVSLQAPDGMNATLTGATDAQLETPFPTSGTVEWTTEAGNISFFSSGAAAATVHTSNITGTWTNVTHIDADPYTITIDPEDKPSFVVGNEIDNIAVRDSFGVDDGTVDFVYGGSTGQSRVTIQGVPSNLEITAVDANTGALLDSATSGSNGAITFDALDNSQHPVLLQQQDFADPVLSNPSPTGPQSNSPSSISIDVTDADFPDGDSVDVTIDLDGSQIHTETITANQTVSVSIPAGGQTGGSHQWRVAADPDFGSEVVETYSYSVPDTLWIRNARNHSEVLTSPINSNVTFFGDDVIITRQTNSGSISLANLPVNQDFVAEVDPSDENWTGRALYVDSIYQQQDVYLLNTSAVSTIESRFTLNDPTGQYGTQSVVFIERPIEVSGTTSWRVVHSDEFGTEGVTAVLEEGQRYRIRVQNKNGREQVVGPYRAEVSEQVIVEPGTPGIDLGQFEDGWAANAVLDNRTLTYRYSDPEGETDEVEVAIYEKGNPSNRLQVNESYFDLGNFSAQSTLTENESEKTWVVVFAVDRGDEEFVKRVEVSNRSTLFSLPEPWDAILGIIMLLMLGGIFSEINVSTGAVIVAAVGGILYYVQLLGGAPTAIGIMLGMFVAVINQLRKRS